MQWKARSVAQWWSRHLACKAPGVLSPVCTKRGKKVVEHQWLSPVILGTREAEIRRIAGQSHQGQIDRPCLENTQHKKGLTEWLKY
jgi:hypothetical protein